MSKARNGQAKPTVIYVNHVPVQVSQEIADFDRKYRQNQRYYARRDGKCGTSDFRCCTGDCGHCPWVRDGFNMLSFEKAFGSTPGCDDGIEQPSIANIPDTRASLVEDIVADRDLLDRLMSRLDSIVPDGGQIVRMLTEEYTDRQMTKELNLPSQSTFNYRKRKVQKYLQEHWHDFFE